MAVLAEPVRQRLALEDYYSMPEDSRYEFDNGELLEMPAPHSRHQRVCSKLNTVLDTYLTTERLGEVFPAINFQLDDQRSFIPDLVILRKEHLDRLDEETGRLRGPADVVIEIVSTDSSSRDRVTKFYAYHQAGVEWYWLIDRDSLVIEEYSAGPEGYVRAASAEKGAVFRPQALPGLEFNLEEMLT